MSTVTDDVTSDRRLFQVFAATTQNVRYFDILYCHCIFTVDPLRLLLYFATTWRI